MKLHKPKIFFLKKITMLTVMRAIAAVSLGSCLLAVVYVGFLQETFAKNNIKKIIAKDGKMNLEVQNFANHKPIFLNGQWEYYPGIFYIGDSFERELLRPENREIVTMPIDSVYKSVGPATYRLLLQTDISLTDFSFYLPSYGEEFAIYINGHRILPVWGGPQEKLLYTLSDYMYSIDIPLLPGEIEIIISANSDNNQSLFYRKSILFGVDDYVMDYVVTLWRDDTFLIGVVLILIVIGLVFMMMRTQLDMLSSIALFDTFLAVRIFLGFEIASYFIHKVVPWIQIGNVEFVGLEYTAFFVTGAFGCILSQSVYDPKRLLAVWPIRLQIIMCLAGGLFNLFFFKKMPLVCIVFLLLLLLGSFIIVSWHLLYVIKEKKFNLYYAFQSIKTGFVGIIMFVDILNMYDISYNAIVYCYVIFMLAHLFARLIDSNSSYREVENLNRNLEEKILERTCELTKANQMLSELSIRDKLTQAYNRLYFERLMEETLAQYHGENIFLCMFDLDHFKRINDTYGHDVGDEQLKFVVEIVNETLPKTATLSRLGGEEFVIMFINEPCDSVVNYVESIRLRLERDAKDNNNRTTASFGLVKYFAGCNEKEFLKLADICLFKAKDQGRNCIKIDKEMFISDFLNEDTKLQF